MSYFRVFLVWEKVTLWELYNSNLGGIQLHLRINQSTVVYRRYPFIHLDEEGQCGVKFLSKAQDDS